MRLRRTTTVVAVAVAALGALAPAAQACTSGSHGGWHPYRGGPQDFAAGALCPFALHIGVIRDEEEIRTTASNPDGSPKEIEFRGPLVLRYVNKDTGASVVRDQSGWATLYYRADGSKLWVIPKTSHITAKFKPGNPYHALGDYLLSGGAVVLVHPNGQPEVLAAHHEENLCQTLA